MSTYQGNIRFIKRAELDSSKYDACIDRSENGLLYAYSFYQDTMAIQWDTLVLNDYEAVMPLVWNNKWRIKYLYQPPFTQQLGVFSFLPITHDLLHAFFTQLEKYFKFAEIFLNYQNNFTGLIARKNYILKLDKDYELIAGNYKDDLKKNLKRSERFLLKYQIAKDIPLLLQLFRINYQKRMPHVKQEAYRRFEQLCLMAVPKKNIIARHAIGEDGDIISGVVLIRAKSRMHLLQSVTTLEGRRQEANHFLLDSLIKEFCGQELILDFEGSEISGIANFYQNFGGVNQPYFYFRLNKLPWPLRLFK